MFFSLLATIAAIVYLMATFFVFSYSLVQISLIFYYKRAAKISISNTTSNPNTLPFVTIQLPVYNEFYVVDGLIDAILEINYPKNLLEIQFLDDSSDETSNVISSRIEAFSNRGILAKHIRRESRIGYKAGALEYGLKMAQGSFITIFDADFRPPKDFLMQTIPFFDDKMVGVVQTKWGHTNEDFSILTQLQAFGLDAHFSIEQVGRNTMGSFINFNGTAGIWRKETIIDAGGWSADTLTEDLDLSYRAQMKGWKFVYLEGVVCPAELPVSMHAVQAQQYRWTKGAAECLLKNYQKLVAHPNISMSTKLHGFYHLANSSIFVMLLLIGVLSFPLFFLIDKISFLQAFSPILYYFQISWFVLAYFYWIPFRRKKLGFFKFLIRFPLFLIMMMGLSWSNSLAVLEAWVGKKTPFVRTPKFNIQSGALAWKKNKYLQNVLGLNVLGELFLFIYFLIVVYYEYTLKIFNLLPFHLMLLAGFGIMLFFTWRHKK